LEAVGIDFNLEQSDVASRGNFCTIDKEGLVTDRRAGRISTAKCEELCGLLSMTIEDGDVIVRPVKEHRFVAIFRGEGLSDEVTESDPQQPGVAPLQIEGNSRDSGKTAGIINGFIKNAASILQEHYPANMVLLRGFAKYPVIPSMNEIYKLTPAAIASYPMYRGLSKLVGMDVLPTGTRVEDEIVTLEQNYEKYDFFFLHVKATDAAGEDGDFDRKVSVIEDFDSLLPSIMKLNPDVVVVTGDHSTPAMLKGHSWHPVPVLLYSKWCRADRVSEFSESECISGGLGRLPATNLMPLAMANALKLTKFGA